MYISIYVYVLVILPRILVQYQVCRSKTFIDTDARPGWMAGTLQFGEAHASGKMPVQGIEGYRIFLADDCGEQVGMGDGRVG